MWHGESIRTRLTDLLGVEHPVIQAPMGTAAGPVLASAVSAAGGLGTISVSFSRLEAIAPQMKNKGRLRVGADADITVFDPGRVRDTATFEKGLSFSAGIDHVLVHGVPVVRDGKTVPNTFPGKAVLGSYGVAR